MRSIAPGQRFGRLVVERKISKRESPIGHTVWVCRCDCGKETMVRGGSLGVSTHSCGCLNAERISTLRHGLKNTPIWNSWHSMLQRCRDSRVQEYYRYGGRGIKVCDRWLEFRMFLLDMGQRPFGHSLGRIDNDGDYAPGNCRWETASQQQRNTSYNRREEYLGETLAIVEWAERFGVSHKQLRNYMRTRPFAEALNKCLGDTSIGKPNTCVGQAAIPAPGPWRGLFSGGI